MQQLPEEQVRLFNLGEKSPMRETGRRKHFRMDSSRMRPDSGLPLIKIHRDNGRPIAGTGIFFDRLKMGKFVKARRSSE